MSEKFEQSIKDWYSNSRAKSLEYLDLADKPTPTNADLANNISIIYDRVSLLSKVTLRHFYSLEEENRLLHKEVAQLKGYLQRIEEDQVRFRPLTRADLQTIVYSTIQQPKGEILQLTKTLKESIVKVEGLVKEVKNFIGE